MTTALSNLLALLSLDDTAYRKGLDSALKQGDTFGQKFAAVGGGIVAGGLTLAVAGLTAVGGVLVAATKEALDAEQTESKLNATLANTGKLTGVTFGMVQQLAGGYEKLTRYEDHTVMSGAEVLAGFKEINSTVFPEALGLTLDLATRLGTDVPDAAKLLGKALADPGVGLLRLKQAGVVFTDQQEAMIKKMVAANDVAGAQALIMDVVKQSVGGAAEAAGKTAAGTWDRLHNQWLGILETIGGKLVPVISQLGQSLITYLTRPDVQAFVTVLAQKLSDLAMTIVTQLPAAVGWIMNLVTFLQNNQGIVIGILAALGAAAMAWGITTAIAAITAIAPMLPVIAVLLAIGAVAYLLYQAWTTNWGGIQEKTAAVLAWIQTAFQNVVDFLMNVWNNPLLQLGVQTLLANIRLIVGAFQAAMNGDWTRFGEMLRMVWDNAWRMIGIILLNAWNGIRAAIGSLINSVITTFQTTDWGQVGRNIIAGIRAGMMAVISWITDAARSVAKAALAAAKGFLGIKSPSTVFEREVGYQMAMGTIAGWQSGIQGLLPALNTSLALQPAAAGGVLPASVSTATAGGAERPDDLMLMLQEVRQLLRDLPNTVARANRDAFEKARRD